ncbi:MAG: stalk domain-containing protein [Eubacteriales bacterium]|nr:stalk domain-containing protein [Eubacteriales bacterium]
MKKIVVTFLVTIILTGTVYGTSTIQSVLRSDINVQINSKALSLKDGKGNQLYPISYNDTIYLPVRSIGENLNLDVKWDDKTKTINLVSKDKTNEKTAVKQADSKQAQSQKIKGNKKSKIYHLPNGQYYNRVSEKNAVYFDSVEDAVKAGYRPAER